jgi:hypothetical protein
VATVSANWLRPVAHRDDIRVTAAKAKLTRGEKKKSRDGSHGAKSANKVISQEEFPC